MPREAPVTSTLVPVPTASRIRAIGPFFRLPALDFGPPDETREFPHGRAEILSIGGGEVGRLVLEPGWRWSNNVKPITNAEAVEADVAEPVLALVEHPEPLVPQLEARGTTLPRARRALEAWSPPWRR